jgi:polysaccharide pyruvyl transferase WcaK-like protein
VAILAEQLRKIHLETGFGVLLLPLGQAAGHEDNEPLQKIAGLLEDVPAEHIPSPDVADTLACIAGARLFVGSSLHGNLMALVYGVPHVGFGERVRKLDLMLRTWDPTRPNGATLPSAIAADALKVLEGDQQVLTRAASSLREAALTALETQSRLLR